MIQPDEARRKYRRQSPSSKFLSFRTIPIISKTASAMWSQPFTAKSHFPFGSDIASGSVSGHYTPAITLSSSKFLVQIDTAVPADLDVHLGLR
jgi:hypothetical protein